MNNNFSVPNPCHEKWDGMQPKENGRYCGSCQKVVVDFTTKTNEEIIDYIKENSQKQVCGTFKNSQLSQQNSYQNHEKSIRFLAAALLVFGMTLFSCNSVDLGDKPEPDPENHLNELTGVIVAPPVMGQTISSHHSFTSPIIEDSVVECKNTIGEPKFPNKKQDTIKVRKGDEIVGIVDQMPEFPGLMQFIQNNLTYPKIAIDRGFSGTVYVTFVVKKDGSIDNVKILRGFYPACDSEALRVVSSMPNWKPGKNKGQLANVQMNLPVKFRLK